VRRVVAFVALPVAAAALAGCGFGSGGSSETISGTGVVGQEFDGPGGLQVQLVRYHHRVARPAKDVTGLATPKKGTHFVAFLIRMCVGTTGLPTLSQRNFTAPLAAAGGAELKFPETVYTDDLNLLGTPGCEQGHIVFQVPRRGRVSELRFALDVRKGDARGYTHSTKIRFGWKLPA
jgi:hypothetical protein